MFFSFCSDKEYERQYWCTIWGIEMALQSIILTYEKQFLYFNRRTIKTKTINLMKRLQPEVNTQAFLPMAGVIIF